MRSGASRQGHTSCALFSLAPRHSPLATLSLLVAGVAVAVSGCGYTIGSAFQHNVQTVYVPIATSEDFRRGPEFQLTEAVARFE